MRFRGGVTESIYEKVACDQPEDWRNGTLVGVDHGCTISTDKECISCGKLQADDPIWKKVLGTEGWN